MYPQIHFNKYELRQWVGYTWKNLYDKMEALRVAVKKATDYQWDNTHFVVDDIYGKPAVQIQFDEKGIALWNYRNGIGLGYITGGNGVTSDKITEIQVCVEKVEKGLTRCNVCKTWVDSVEPSRLKPASRPRVAIHRYSWAGGVCSKCYDPKKHLPPDTRGD